MNSGLELKIRVLLLRSNLCDLMGSSFDISSIAHQIAKLNHPSSYVIKDIILDEIGDDSSYVDYEVDEVVDAIMDVIY